MRAPPLLRVLLVLAMLLMPLGMAGGGAATASGDHAPMATAAAHCADIHRQSKQVPPGHSPGCMPACAAIPAAGIVLEPHALEPIALRPAPWRAGHGLHPEAATPPPRIS